MFVLKKALAPLLYPLPLSMLILLVGIGLLWLSKRERLAKIVVSIGALLLLLTSWRPVADRLVHWWEAGWSSVLLRGGDAKERRRLGQVKWIVVLGGGQSSNPRLPVTSHLSAPSTVRLLEGIRLHRLIPGSRILLMGGAPFSSRSEADVMADLALALGVKRRVLVKERKSLDTRAQARLAGRFVGRERFLLVTSAVHMRRSVGLFKGQGLKPIPAPTDHQVVRLGRPGFRPGDVFPNGGNLRKVRLVVHEWLGYAYAGLRGWLK